MYKKPFLKLNINIKINWRQWILKKYKYEELINIIMLFDAYEEKILCTYLLKKICRNLQRIINYLNNNKQSLIIMICVLQIYK